MSKQKVDHHASIVAVRNGDRLFLGGYDQGYPWFPGYANFMGGNHEKGIDFTPWDILRREITEETSPSSYDGFDSQENIIRIRNKILENAVPVQDFIITDPVIEKIIAGEKRLSLKPGRLRESIVSFYESDISKELMDYIEETLDSGKKIVSEGWSSVTNIEDLKSGKVILAWAAPEMGANYLRTLLPNPHNSRVVSIGKPRHSLKDYLSDFEYVMPVTSD